MLPFIQTMAEHVNFSRQVPNVRQNYRAGVKAVGGKSRGEREEARRQQEETGRAAPSLDPTEQFLASYALGSRAKPIVVPRFVQTTPPVVKEEEVEPAVQVVANEQAEVAIVRAEPKESVKEEPRKAAVEPVIQKAKRQPPPRPVKKVTPPVEEVPLVDGADTNHRLEWLEKSILEMNADIADLFIIIDEMQARDRPIVIPKQKPQPKQAVVSIDAPVVAVSEEVIVAQFAAQEKKRRDTLLRLKEARAAYTPPVEGKLYQKMEDPNYMAERAENLLKLMSNVQADGSQLQTPQPFLAPGEYATHPPPSRAMPAANASDFNAALPPIRRREGVSHVL